MLDPRFETVFAKAALRKDADSRVPVLWHSEFLSILAGYLRSNQLTFDQTLSIIKSLERRLRGKEHRPNSEAVLKLVKRCHCSAYDCEYVALAEELRVPLVSEDQLLLETFPQTTLSIEAFLANA